MKMNWNLTLLPELTNRGIVRGNLVSDRKIRELKMNHVILLQPKPCLLLALRAPVRSHQSELK